MRQKTYESINERISISYATIEFEALEDVKLYVVTKIEDDERFEDDFLAIARVFELDAYAKLSKVLVATFDEETLYAFTNLFAILLRYVSKSHEDFRNVLDDVAIDYYASLARKLYDLISTYERERYRASSENRESARREIVERARNIARRFAIEASEF